MTARDAVFMVFGCGHFCRYVYSPELNWPGKLGTKIYEQPCIRCKGGDCSWGKQCSCWYRKDQQWT